MAVTGSVDVALDIFGGLVTDMAPADLPAGVSWDCQDVSFVPGSVKTRPGLLSIFTPIGGIPAVNYLKTYVPPTGLLRLLALDAAGSLWKESSVGVLSLVQSGIVANSFAKSTSLFTREYLAIGDGKFGIDLPRQFDDTNFDRVSQVGPGQSPGVTDETATFTLANPNGIVPFGSISPITNLSEAGNIVTISLTGLPGVLSVSIGDSIAITAAVPAGYNGTFPLLSVSTTGTTATMTVFNPTSGLAPAAGSGTFQQLKATFTFTPPTIVTPGLNVTVAGTSVAAYNATFKVLSNPPPGAGFFSATITATQLSGGSSNGGTFTIIGNITAGVHQISVVFVTRQGYITAPAPPLSWTAAGSKRAVVASIAIGPPNVVARILLFTLVGQADFFYSKGITGIATSNFVIQDNTTTTATVDFTDIGLAAQVSADNLFRLLELGECSGTIDYSSRLFWWGERNKVENFNNLTFDGGFSANSGSLYTAGFPLGWALDSTGLGGGALSTFTNAYWGFAYAVSGDGATATRGKIAQSAFQDQNGVPILSPNTAYSVRARVARDAILNTGTVHINLQSTSGAFTTTGLQVTAAQAGLAYAEFTATILASQTTIPSDLLLQVYADGTPNVNGHFLLDCIEIFPTNQPNNSSLVRASNAEDPESYDGLTGFLNVNENDGFAVRSAFVIRENLYFVKEHSTYVTQDDGVTEPSGWTITEVSRKVGTPSVNGVAVGQDWAVVAHRTGLYFTDGGQPKKISQEIQPTWDRINWAAGQTLWTQIDLQNRRIYIGVPIDGATAPNKVLMLDYRGIDDPPNDIATSAPIHTSYSGKLLVLERSRKWSIWNIAANSGAIVERFDGTQQMFLGNGTGTGKIYQLSDSQFTDDGATIAGYYNTYFHFSHDLEQAFQVGSHNKLYNYLSAFVEGSGSLVLSAIHPGNAPAEVIASIPLVNPALRDIEFPINVTAVRAAFKISTANNGDWFRMARFIVNAIKHPSAPVRGWN